MSLTVKIVDDTREWNAMMTRMKDLKSVKLYAGYPLGAKLKKGTRKGSGRKPWLSMEELVRVAFFHEFGTSKMQARETLRPAYDKNEGEIINRLAIAADEVLHKKRRIDHALGAVGRFIVSKIREEIDKLPRDLRDSTIDRKGHDAPLIDSKQMYNSVGYELRR